MIPLVSSTAMREHKRRAQSIQRVFKAQNLIAVIQRDTTGDLDLTFPFGQYAIQPENLEELVAMANLHLIITICSLA